MVCIPSWVVWWHCDDNHLRVRDEGGPLVTTRDTLATIGAAGMTSSYDEGLNKVRGFPQAKDNKRQLKGGAWEDNSCVNLCVCVCVWGGNIYTVA